MKGEGFVGGAVWSEGCAELRRVRGVQSYVG